MRKNPHVEARLAALGPNDKIVVCPIVRGEILYGLARLPQGRRRDNLTKQRERCAFLVPRPGARGHFRDDLHGTFGTGRLRADFLITGR
jgi:hypothetical protein